MRKALYILGELEDRDMIWLSQHGRVRRIAAGEALISEGHLPADLFFVTDGVFAVISGGRTIAEVALGDVLGEMSFVEKRAPSTSVIASEPSRVLAVPRSAFLAAFERDAAFAARFYRALAVFLSDRLRSATAPAGDDAEELDEGILDNVSMAGDRFVRLIAVLEGHDR